MKLYYIFLGIALLYLAASFFVGIATYKKIRRNTKKRHWGILIGEWKLKAVAVAMSISSALMCSRKIIKMPDDEVERELDIQFCPTHLI